MCPAMIAVYTGFWQFLNIRSGTCGGFEKPAPLALRGTLRDLSIGGRGLTINGLRYSGSCPFPQTLIPLMFFDVPLTYYSEIP